MERVELSRYVQIVSRSQDFAVYHSLFGQLCLMDHEEVDLLRSFRTPKMDDDAILYSYGNMHRDIGTYLSEFRNRYFLVPEGFDEYELVNRDIERRRERLRTGYLVRGLQLVTSNDCNFRCKYCIVDHAYNSKERSEFQNDPFNKMMSVEIAKMSVVKLIDMLRRNGNRHLDVEFFGGEPLMNWPVMESVLETFKNGRRGDVEIGYSITTNGSLITERITEVLKGYGVNVVISFDSPKNTERVLADGRNSSRLVKRGLNILRENENYITFNSVISKDTIDDFDGRGLVDYASHYNIRMIGLILDLDLEFYQNEEDVQRVLVKMWDTYKYAKSVGMPIVGYWHQIFNQIIGRQSINLLSGYKTCPATGCKLSVEPAGHVFICKCCSGYLGHISDLGDVLSSEGYERYALRAYRNAPNCEGCDIEGFCSGVCMGSLERRYDDLNVVERGSCDIFRKITRNLILDLDGDEAERLRLPAGT